MVVDGPWVEDPDDSVMEGDKRDRSEEGEPALIERDDAEHHEEVEVRLDVAAREMGEHGRRHDQPQARGKRSKGTTELLRAGSEGRRRQHASLDQAVVHGVPGRERKDREANGLHPEQDEDASVATVPERRGQRPSLG